MGGIGFEGLDSALFSHNLIMRNYGVGIIDTSCASACAGSFATDVPSNNVSVIDNYVNGNLCGEIEVCSPGTTLDNAQITPGTITRGGVTQAFGTIVNNEVPAGVINGVNINFTLAHTPLPGTLTVWVNGMRVTAFTNTGTALTFSTAPTTSVLADYEY